MALKEPLLCELHVAPPLSVPLLPVWVAMWLVATHLPHGGVWEDWLREHEGAGLLHLALLSFTRLLRLVVGLWLPRATREESA